MVAKEGRTSCRKGRRKFSLAPNSWLLPRAQWTRQCFSSTSRSLSIQWGGRRRLICASGTSIALKPGDLVVLSNLADLFSWRFHLGENRDGSSKCLKRVGFRGDEEQPNSKRPKLGLIW